MADNRFPTIEEILRNQMCCIKQLAPFQARPACRKCIYLKRIEKHEKCAKLLKMSISRRGSVLSENSPNRMMIIAVFLAFHFYKSTIFYALDIAAELASHIRYIFITPGYTYMWVFLSC